MRVKCRRAYLNHLVLALLALFMATSIVLHTEHHKRVMVTRRDQAFKPTGLLETSLEILPKNHKVSPRNVTISIKPQPPKRLPKKNVGSDNKAQIAAPKKQMNMNKADKTDKGVEKNQGVKRVLAQQKEKPEPVASSLWPNATFAACLLIKDDNSILPEWLAYHYHVLRLRHLIVAVDPLSVEYPTKILERWRNATDMQIEEWGDVDYMPSDFLVYQKPPEKYMEPAAKLGPTLSEEDILEINIHRYRQRVFLAKCMRKHKEDGNSWTIHVDTDEQITPSKLLRQMNPDYVTIPPMDQPGAVLNLIQQVVQKTGDKVNYPCLSMLRVLFGSVESTREEIYKDVPPGFNPEHFESLRWRYHALPHNMSFHGNPKVLLDVSAIPGNQFPEDLVFSIHRPVKSYCHRNDELAFTSFRKQPIAVNHFLGSWERYAGRNDKRRSRAKYDAKASVHRGTDDGSRLWLQGFLNTFGFDRARYLLGDYYVASDEFLKNHTRPHMDGFSLE